MEKFSKTYYCDTSFLSDNPELIESRKSEVDEGRQSRIDKARFSDTKADILAGGLIIRYALKDAFGIENAVIETNEFGKPYCKDHPEAHFNISHSGHIIICVTSDVECGVDIEDLSVEHPVMNLANRFLSTLEANAVVLSEDPNKAFCRLWTLRESYVKMRGKGFNIGLSTLRCDFHRGVASMIEQNVVQKDAFFHELKGIPGYQASVCTVEERENTVHKITL